MKQNVKEYTLEELTDHVVALGLPRFCAGQIFDWVYKKRIEDFSRMTNIALKARVSLAESLCFSTLTCVAQETSVDATEKFLFELSDGARIETVLIPEEDRLTLCVSSQVGCKYACSFCASGASGFLRNLSAAEIIDQYLYILDRCAPSNITNIVFMGVGEPLDNFDAVTKAIRILMEPGGLCYGKRRICISTCGLVPAITRLAEMKLGIKLSISLHAPTDALRNTIMPVNKKYPLRTLIAAADRFARAEKYPVTFEYVLIEGLNASAASARALAKLLAGTRCKVNVIPFNAVVAGVSRASHAITVSSFGDELKKHDIFFTVRKSRGADIAAACGQLRARFTQNLR